MEYSSKIEERFIDLIFMMCLNDDIDQLAIASSDPWYGHVLSREDGHVLRKAIDFKVEGQRKKGGRR